MTPTNAVMNILVLKQPNKKRKFFKNGNDKKTSLLKCNSSEQLRSRGEYTSSLSPGINDDYDDM